MKRWLINNFLPLWAKETVLADNARLKKENERLKAKYKRLRYGEYPACDHLNIALRKLLSRADENRGAIQEILFAITKSNGYFYDDVRDAIIKNNFIGFGERREGE